MSLENTDVLEKPALLSLRGEYRKTEVQRLRQHQQIASRKQRGKAESLGVFPDSDTIAAAGRFLGFEVTVLSVWQRLLQSHCDWNTSAAVLPCALLLLLCCWCPRYGVRRSQLMHENHEIPRSKFKRSQRWHESDTSDAYRYFSSIAYGI